MVFAINGTNALAAVAVSGAAFAEVTITGGFSYGYKTSKSNVAAVTAVDGTYFDPTNASSPVGQGQTLPAGGTWLVAPVAAVAAGTARASGFGVDTAAITIAATEDLGGGLTASGSMSLGGLTRGDTPTGEDFKMSLSGGFGTLMLGQIEIGSGIRGLGTAGAPVNNMEGEVMDAASSGTDIIKYTAPAMGGVTVSASLTEAKGLGTGSSAGQSKAITVGAVYAANGLTASLDTTNWDNNAKTYDSRYRIAAKYDMGVAAVGIGHEDIDNVGTGSTKFTVMGVSVPLGSVTLGAATVTKKVTGAAKVSGNTIGASYALSKRTSVTANTASWKTAGAVSENKSTLLLNHNF